MAHLSLSCLGPLQVMLGRRPVTGFKSNKVRALLIYLTVEAERPHRREVLAGLLWPEWPDREALSNLRYALSNLRRIIGDHSAEPPFLLISRNTLQFNTNSDYHLDVTDFLAQTKLTHSLEGDLPDLSCFEEAITFCRGSFLEGFSIKDSAAFDEWTLVKRQKIEEQLLCALRHLVTVYAQQGYYEQALVWARQQIELAPWDETAHQQLMRVRALSGQRSAALVQYQTCRRLLVKELGVEPAKETMELYEQIRSGTLHAAGSPPTTPPDLAVKVPRYLEEEPPQVDFPVFVSRERELAQLHSFLKLALAGQGQVAFVTGEAGSGKTALIQEFSRHSQEIVADLCVASGNCNAYTGIGDPYLPFREIVEMLTGDVEAKWAAGAITKEHALRLWNTIPPAAQILSEAGRDLINTFIPGRALIKRVMAYPQLSGRRIC
jgi:DNA-binding SARP family transcriptional activator